VSVAITKLPDDEISPGLI